MSTEPPGHWGQMILAEEAALTLGTAQVEPAVRELRHRGTSLVLEPRVMQVLIVLGRQPGRVVSRDELIARCWDGRAVGDSAINRAISQLRQVAESLGDEAFGIDTIARVGYRLQLPVPAPPGLGPPHQLPPPPPPPLPVPALPAARTRRAWLGGAAVGTALTAAAAWGPALHRPVPAPAVSVGDAEAAALRQRGELALRDGLIDRAAEAVNYLEAAARREPGQAAHWGLLALAYAAQRNFGSETALDPLAVAARAAAERAEALAPGQADAAVARLMIEPLFRNWHAVEQACAALLRRHPRHWLLHSLQGRVWADTGRWKQAAAALERALDIDPLLPGVRARHAQALWCTGQVGEAQRGFDAAIALWPRHWVVWHLALEFRMFTGRLGDAAALLAEHRPGPRERSLLPRELALRTLQALGDPVNRPMSAALATDIVAARRAGTLGSQAAVPILAALGRPDEAFALLQPFYFGGAVDGREIAPPHAGAARVTHLLFLPPLAPLQPDSRFAALTRDLQLDSYWRLAQVGPDHRPAQPSRASS